MDTYIFKQKSDINHQSNLHAGFRHKNPVKKPWKASNMPEGMAYSTSSCLQTGLLYVTDSISLRYPVLLVHGAGFEDTYCKEDKPASWGSIPRHLKSKGIRVFFGNTKAWAPIEENAQILKNNIIFYRENFIFDKINIIAHSMGGLESRYMISKLGMSDYVASLTTISTPHHGLKTIEALHDTILYKKIIEILATRYFGSYENFLKMSLNLKCSSCRSFNKEIADIPAVYYQSYGADMKSVLHDPFLSVSYKIINYYDGCNDGLVPVSSAVWGNYKGTFQSIKSKGLSHRDLIDVHNSDTRHDIIENYFEIVRNLQNLGF
ncbi:triacylglycerol lipase [Ruminiclostridium sufflavum DSM 19573]|uniref:Triacylglycerol lipase n=1 Tax=Ruminiclostridium sufflavum DSM 19573 TaxID=1121337 RepID=A0A318XPF4_9FIRM|nr:alpha/beta fold hydrolase [Ruminiclostridium sufflavum]PYG90191.1 triacylglycerol lipase [Ruminiclostridium sufflavum DSM 19573]